MFSQISTFTPRLGGAKDESYLCYFFGALKPDLYIRYQATSKIVQQDYSRSSLGPVPGASPPVCGFAGPSR